MTHFIYIICDPSGKVRYLGKTVNMKVRSIRHFHAPGAGRKDQWIQSIKAEGLMPIIQVIDECNDGEWQDTERFWIAFFRSTGCELLNRDDGGDSSKGWTYLRRVKGGRLKRIKPIPHPLVHVSKLDAKVAQVVAQLKRKQPLIETRNRCLECSTEQLQSQ